MEESKMSIQVPTMYELYEKSKELYHNPTRKGFNEYVRDITTRHLHPEWGAEYWINFNEKKQLKLGDNGDIQTFDDFIAHLGPVDEEVFRYSDIFHFVPKIHLKEMEEYKGKAKILILETGGTTGAPKRSIFYAPLKEYMRTVEMASDVLDKVGIPREKRWIGIIPTGPHIVGKFIQDLAEYRKSPLFLIDLDSRWIKKLGMEGDEKTKEKYIKHIMDQAMNPMIRQKISIIYTTPIILEKMINVLEIMKDKGVLDGIIFAGAPMRSKETYKILREISDFKITGQYGNSLFNILVQDPNDLKDPNNLEINYFSSYPRIISRVVDKDNWEKEVEYGEEGRVMLSRLEPDGMYPFVEKSDLGTRIPPRGEYKWDGVRNPHYDVERLQKGAEGVY